MLDSPPAAAAVSPRQRIPAVALFVAMAISLVGSQLTALAIPWFVLTTTGSAARTGYVGFVEVVPVAVVALLGGLLVDRLPYKRTSIGADVMSGASVALIPALYATVGLAFWQLLVLVFIASLFIVPGTTARSAMVPDLADLAGMRLERVTATTQSIQRGAVLVGAPLAGVVIALVGPSRALWVDAASFVISAAIIAVLVPSRRREPRTDAPRGYLGEVLEGVRFIRRDRLMLAIVVTVMLTNGLDISYSMLMTFYAKQVYDSSVALGLIVGVMGGGALVGAVFFGVVGHRLPRRQTFVWSFNVVALSRLPLLSFPPLGVTLAARVIGGVASGPINPVLGTVNYRRIPAALRGRVLGAITAGVQVGAPVGVAVTGITVERYGLRPVLIAVTFAYVVVTAALVWVRAFREMDAPGLGERGSHAP